MNPGTYRARAIEGMLGYTQGGKEQVAVKFALEDSGEHITWYGYFTDKTTDRTLESLMVAGWDGDDLGKLDGLGTKDVELVIVEDEYNGNKRLKVNWVNRPYGGALKHAMPQADAVSFAEKMKGRAMALKQKMATNDEDNSEMPF